MTGGYSFTFSSRWLSGASISAATVKVDSGTGDVDIGQTRVEGSVVYVRLTGKTAGYAMMRCDITTDDGRNDCLSGRLVVTDDN